MALSNSQYNAVMREYEKRQLKNRHERDARIARVYQQVPQLKQLGTGNQRSGGGLRKAEPFRKSGKDKRDEGAAGGNAAPKKGAVEKQRFP